MSKFKVGDVVKLKKGLTVGCVRQRLILLPAMVDNFGMSRTVISVCCFTPHYLLDNGFYYSENMLESVVTDKVYYRNKYDYVYDYDYDLEMYTYKTDKIVWRKTLKGGELLDLIGDKLKDNHILEFHVFDNEIYISTFNPHNGTGSDIKIKMTEVKQENASEKKNKLKV